MKDFYYILGTNANCTSVELTEAYKKLAEKFHPESNPHDQYFQNHFNEIREAYEVLSDPEKRSKYDAELRRLKPASAEEQDRIKKYYSKSNGINIGLTLVLVALAVVFGHYVFKSVYSPKAQAVVKAPVISPAPPVHKARHRRRKHLWQARIAALHPAVTKPLTPAVLPQAASHTAMLTRADIARKHPVAPAGSAGGKLMPAAADKRLAVTARTQPAVSAVRKDMYIVNAESHTGNMAGSTYSTVIRANETGAVNLRRTDDFNSAIIREIPDNARVNVLAKGRFYYKVMYDNTVGYVPKWTVQDK